MLVGSNGSGKSTLARKIIEKDRLSGKVLLGFQEPVAVPGVNYNNFLRIAYNKGKKQLGPLEFYQLLKEKAKFLEIPEEFLSRDLNLSFSGGEKKKMEILQALVLEPKFAIFDEPDSGMDVHNQKLLVKGLKYLLKKRAGILLITHNPKFLKSLKPVKVYKMKDGQITN